MGGACSTNGGDEECIQNFIRKREGKTPLVRPRRRRIDNIKMDVRIIGYEYVLDSSDSG
jgi:hypothetical protein